MRVSSNKSYLYPVCKQIMFLPAEGIVWVFVSVCVSVRMPKWLHADTNWSKNYHKGCFECFGRCFSVVIQSKTMQVRSNWTLSIGVVWKLICDMAGIISSQSHLMDGLSFFDCVYFVFWLIATPDTHVNFWKNQEKVSKYHNLPPYSSHASLQHVVTFLRACMPGYIEGYDAELNWCKLWPRSDAEIQFTW